MTGRALLVVALCAGSAQAATIERFETFDSIQVRGAILGRATGARAVAMGEAFTAVADDASAVSWNPAGLGQVGSFSAVAAYESAGPEFGVSYVAVAAPLGIGVAGAAVAFADYGTYDVRNEYGVRVFTDSLSDAAAVFSCALPNPRWIGKEGWTGVSLEAVSEAAGGSLVGVSAGTLVVFASSLSVGLVVEHLGPKSNGFGLPSAAKGGVAYAGWGPVRLSADAGYGLASGQLWAAGGVEYTPVRAAAARAGYRWRAQAQELDGLSGVTFGFGVRYGGFGIDYAYQPFGGLAVSHRISLVYGGGASRREEPAIGRSGPRPAAASEDSAAAVSRLNELYSAGSYDEVLRLALGMVSADPGNWKAWHAIGNCRYAKGDRPGAVSAYRRSLEINPDNPSLRAWADQLDKQ